MEQNNKKKISQEMKDVLLTNLGTVATILLFGVAFAYLVKKYAEQDGTLYFIVILCTFIVVCGLIFLIKTLKDKKKLLERKESLSKLEETAKGTTDVVLNQSKEAAKKLGNDVANIVKPYGEVAKGQFNEAKVVGKDLINKGSKKLIKILEDLENKTKTK